MTNEFCLCLVSVLLSLHIEKVGISCIRDFLIHKFTPKPSLCQHLGCKAVTQDKMPYPMCRTGVAAEEQHLVLTFDGIKKVRSKVFCGPSLR